MVRRCFDPDAFADRHGLREKYDLQKRKEEEMATLSHPDSPLTLRGGRTLSSPALKRSSSLRLGGSDEEEEEEETRNPRRFCLFRFERETHSGSPFKSSGTVLSASMQEDADVVVQADCGEENGAETEGANEEGNERPSLASSPSDALISSIYEGMNGATHHEVFSAMRDEMWSNNHAV